MKLLDSIFRTYDIRGIYPTELDEVGALHIGRAYGTYLKRLLNVESPKIVVGRDNRSSSPQLCSGFIIGLVDTGCRVTDIGVSLTPIIHFLTCTEDFDAGSLVTASHNPKEYNGFRLDLRNAESMFGDQIKHLNSLIEKEDYDLSKGSVVELDLFPKYLEFLKSNFSFQTGPKVLLNCGYGTASIFAERIFKELGCIVEEIFCVSDEDFPNGVPNPENREFMAELQKGVKEHTVDVGFAFDNDCDRFGMVDEKGTIYDNDKVLLLLSEHLLQSNPNAKISFDVKSTSLVEKMVTQWGGSAEMLRTGHPYFMKKVKDDSLLGAEFSGHVYYGKPFFGYDDGIFAACKILEIITSTQKSLSSLMSEFPTRAHTSEIKLTCRDNEKFDLMDKITSKINGKKEEFDKVIVLDGVRVELTPSSWFLIRASNTSPYLSLRVEGKNETEVELLLQGIADLLAEYKSLDLSVLASSEIYVS